MAMALADQEARLARRDDPDRAERLEHLDRLHTERLRQIVERFGWPGRLTAGEAGSQAAWLLVQHADLIQVFAQDSLTPESTQIFAEAERKLRNMFAAGIKAGMEAGAFRVSDPVLTATFLNHAIHGTVEQAILYEGGVDRDRVVAGARELMRRVLSP